MSWSRSRHCCFLILSHFASNAGNSPTSQQSVHLSVAQLSFPCQGMQVMRVKGVDMPQQCKKVPSQHQALSNFCSCCVSAYPGQWHMYFQRMLAWVKSHRVGKRLPIFIFSNSFSPFSQNPAPRGTGNLWISSPKSPSSSYFSLPSFNTLGAAIFTFSMGCLLMGLPVSALVLFQ